MLKKILLFMTTCSLLSACQNAEVRKIGYKGDKLMDKAIILRDKTTKKATLNIQVDGEWKLYAGKTVETIDLNKPILTGNQKGDYPLNIDTSSRVYFQLETEKGTAILADKHLPMDGGYNFRDMGGIQTSDGRYVKWGKIFRSDDMHNLTLADLEYLESIPIASIVDFRTQEEIVEAPDTIPTSVKHRYELTISPGKLSTKEGMDGVSKLLNTVGADSIMRDMNRQLSTDLVCRNQFKEFFKLIQTPQDTPLLFHCSAGKDRTGMAAALFLSALGVDEETIMHDYLLSNTYLADKYAPILEQDKRLEPIFIVQRNYLQAGLNQIKEDYGSVEKYLTEELGVDIDKMRETYLY